MSHTYEDIIRQASEPLESLPTGMTAKLPMLPDIRAVLFDIYGTLVVSGSGDVGSAAHDVRAESFSAALAAAGVEFTGSGTDGSEQFLAEIESHHQQAKRSGVEYPEVDIVAVWQATVAALRTQGFVRKTDEQIDFRRLAIEYETRVNPVWPMPGMEETLAKVRRSGRVLGIISNAQFFTPLVFPAIVGQSLDELGFEPTLRYYSYEHHVAKPGRTLYEMAAKELSRRNIRPSEVLYVGNDLRNDVWPAAAVGFRTALFAGDSRSLRLRESDPHYDQYPQPDAIVTELAQIFSIID